MLLLTGATGFLGKRVRRLLDARAVAYTPTSLSLGVDLRDPAATTALFERVAPTKVLHCAAYVGGIGFGLEHPAEMFRNNLLMTINMLEACRVAKVARLVNPIANCAYPARLSYFREEDFWDGPLHESVMVYGFARKASWVGSYAYEKQYGTDCVNLILSNMYGPEDHFEEVRSHALGALVMKMMNARDGNLPEVVVWGTGKPVREWLYVDDGAEAMIRGLDAPKVTDAVNVGSGSGVSIAELAERIKAEVGFKGQLVFDTSKQDGAAHKTMDGTRGRELLGWSPKVKLAEGIRETVRWLEAERKASR